VGFVFQFFQLAAHIDGAENGHGCPWIFAGFIPYRSAGNARLDLLHRVGVRRKRTNCLALSPGANSSGPRSRAPANDPPVILLTSPRATWISVTATAVLDLFRAAWQVRAQPCDSKHERDITRLVDRKVEVADGSLASVMRPRPWKYPRPPMTAPWQNPPWKKAILISGRKALGQPWWCWRSAIGIPGFAAVLYRVRSTHTRIGQRIISQRIRPQPLAHRRSG